MPLTPEVWLAEQTVNIGNTSGLQNQPQLTQLADGRILVAWVDHEDNIDTASGRDIYGQLYDLLGSPLGAPFRMNTTFSNVDEDEFEIAARPGGGWVLAYESSAATDMITVDVYDNNGVFDSAASTYSTPPFSQTYNDPAVAVNAAGDIVVIWNVTESGDTTAHYRFHDASAGTWTAPIAHLASSNQTNNNSASVSVSAMADGSFIVVANRDNATAEDIVARFINADGTNTSSLFGVSTLANNNEAGPDVVGLTGGGFVAVWHDVDTYDTDGLFRVFDSAGVPVTGYQVVVNSSNSGPDNKNELSVTALPDGGFFIVWDDDIVDRINGQRYDAAGSAVGSLLTMSGSGVQYAPETFGLADGRIASTWINGNDIVLEIRDTRDADNQTGYSAETWQLGTVGDETITALAGSDSVHGWDGNDAVSAVDLSTAYYGGDGSDNVAWGVSTLANTGGIFSLIGGTASDGVTTTVMAGFEDLFGTNGNDSILGSNVANDLRGYDGADTIAGLGSADNIDGGDGDDSIDGGSGNDTIDGGAGNDTIDGSSGIDSLNGGDDIDTLTFASATEGVSISRSFGGGNSSDTISGANGPYDIVANFEIYEGTHFNDTLIGDVEADIFYGLNGNDTINGYGNDDTLIGGTGDDTIRGGIGNDHIVTGIGANIVDGGDDDDFVDATGSTVLSSIEGGDGQDTLSFASHTGSSGVRLWLGEITGSDTIDGFFYQNEFEVFEGSSLNDDIEGNNIAGNHLRGLGGDDEIDGRGGNDTLEGGNGLDTLHGGTGADSLSGGRGNDSLDGGNGNDTLQGNEDDDVLSGGEGDDSLSGGSDNDTLLGEADNDTLEGNGGDDSLNGGNGDDSLVGGTGSDTLIGSNSDDTLRGDTGADSLNGGNGDDSLEGGDQDDTLVGGGGTDTLRGGAGDDRLEIDVTDGLASVYGGTGTNTLYITSDASMPILNVRVGSFGELRYFDGTSSISSALYDVQIVHGGAGGENFYGSDDDDIFYGNGGSNSGNGGGGNDQLFDVGNASGGEGDDLITGIDFGFGSLNGGAGSDTIMAGDTSTNMEAGFDLTGMTLDHLEGGSGNDSLNGANQIAGFGDMLVGNGGDDRVNAHDGDDTARGGAGDDDMSGGNGDDDMSGGADDDTLEGDAGNDTLNGGTGADTVLGGSDDDSLSGAGGRDHLEGSSGLDTLSGGTGNDTLLGGNGNDDISGDGGNDSLSGGGNDDTLRGGAGDDTLLGDNGNDQLIGNLRSDLLRGGAGNDTLRGGDGRDTLEGGSGDDDLRGEAGADTFVFGDGWGVDRIFDFDAFNNAEQIDLSGATAITDYADLTANHMAQVGGYVIIDDGLGNTLRLDGASLADLDPIDFIF